MDDSNMDMEIDLGLDMEVDEEAMIIMEADAPAPQHEPELIEDVQKAHDSVPLAAEKVHIRGLDDLTTDHLKTFISENSAIDFLRIEWIDDTSANIVYNSADIASSALSDFLQLSAPLEEGEDLTELRRAKRLTSHPATELHVRIAFPTDTKKQRAADSSRFYLLNPEYDPRERRRKQDGRDERRRGYGDRRYNKQSRDDEGDTPFDQSMYDDDPDSLAARINRPLQRRRSHESITSDDSRRIRNARHANGRGDDLFGDRLLKSNADERLRNRSASPSRDGDGRFGFDEEQEQSKRRTRRRSVTPPRSRTRNAVNGNAGRELMDTEPSRSGVLQLSSANVNGKDLFPNAAATPPNKELFPRKSTSTRNHRRKDAFDAADETGDLFANRMISGSPERKALSLADRITGGPAIASQEDIGQVDGFSIRGTANQQEGFAIRGSAKALGIDNPKVKELFPEHSEGNEGKELFGGRLAGRGAQRRKAQDMFY